LWCGVIEERYICVQNWGRLQIWSYMVLILRPHYRWPRLWLKMNRQKRRQNKTKKRKKAGILCWKKIPKKVWNLGSLAVYNGNPWLRSKIKPMEWRSIVNPAFFSLILKSRISYCCNQIVLTYPTATACFFRSYHTWTAVWVYSPQLWRFERIQNKKANFEIHILNSILLTPLSRLNFPLSLYFFF